MKKTIVIGSLLVFISMILITTISGIPYQDIPDFYQEKPRDKELYEQNIDDEKGFISLQQDSDLIIIENKRTRLPYDIDVTVSTDKHSYQWIVEPVAVTVTVMNIGSSSVNLTFPTSQLYDIIIKNKRDIEIYRWSDNKYFIQVITEILLQPGEAMNWDIAWYQQGRIFRFLPYRMLIPGTYSIQGIIPTMDTIMESEEHEICIRLFP
jgi:hypothetical protein